MSKYLSSTFATNHSQEADMITNVFIVVCPRQIKQRKVPAFELVRALPDDITRLCFPPTIAGLHCASTISDFPKIRIRDISCDKRMRSPADEPAKDGFSKLERYEKYRERCAQANREPDNLFAYLRMHYGSWYQKVLSEKQNDVCSLVNMGTGARTVNIVLICQNPLSELFALILTGVQISHPKAWQVMRLHRDRRETLFTLQTSVK